MKVEITLTAPKGAGKSHLAEKLLAVIAEQQKQAPSVNIEVVLKEKDKVRLPILCRFGFHKTQYLTLEREPANWMTVGKYYINHCGRCNHDRLFVFDIERS